MEKPLRCSNVSLKQVVMVGFHSREKEEKKKREKKKKKVRRERELAGHFKGGGAHSLVSFICPLIDRFDRRDIKHVCVWCFSVLFTHI